MSDSNTNKNISLWKIASQWLQFVIAIMGLAGAYFMTIQSLKMELADKAERVMVTTLDKKLANFEVILREGVVSKDQFHQFSKDVEKRLGRIEYFLIDKPGEDFDKR